MITTVTIKSNRLIEEVMTVLFLDPGDTTGCARVTIRPEAGLSYTARIVTEAIEHWPDNQAPRILHLLDIVDLLVIEDWRLYAGKGDALTGAALIGPQVLGFAVGTATTFATPVIYQRPVEAKYFYPYARKAFEAEGDWPKTEHERDVLAHLFVYLSKGGSPWV